VKPLRMGMAGLGVASTQILPPVAKLPYVRIAAASDLREDALAKFRKEYDAEVFTDFAAMCKSPNVDFVYIATPNDLHARHAITAAEHGKHAIVEKPMAMNLAECEAMNAAAEKNGTKLLCGHTHSFDPPIRKIREIIRSGELGRLRMVHSWNYNEFMYRPRMKHELAMSRGVVLNQGPHQVDVVRLIGGGMVKSVRATTGTWDPARPHEGSYVGYLEFADGVPATLVYSGYGFFDTAELFWWVGEGGQPRDPETNARVRKKLKGITTAEEEELLKEQMRYGGRREGEFSHDWQSERHQPFFGFTLVSCDKGDIRQSADGLIVYGEEGKKEVALTAGKRGREAEVDELYQAIANDRPVFHDGRWGEATLEVCLAILESAKEKREIFLKHQRPVV
jgi:phthalate 4,5-cis-dihydrodiol dehydrogenase